MNINEIFKDAFCTWVRYSEYEIRKEDELMNLIPAKGATAAPYNPAECIREIALETLNIGKLVSVWNHDIEESRRRVLQFARKYGLLGLMVDLPLNDNFFESGETYLAPGFFKAGRQSTKKFMKRFFSFVDELPKLEASDTSISTFASREPVYEYAFSNEYGEWLLWLELYFKDMYRLFRACEDYIDETDYSRNLELRQEIMRYSDHKLRYNISAGDRPEICWEFASLKAMIDLYIVGSITDAVAPIRECKHCGKVFYAENARLEFCSPQCRNKYNVYKFRRKGEAEEVGEE